MEKGDAIQFQASRIMFGNPVKGTFISEDDEWITVTLHHYIEGMVNSWEAGEEKQFRKTLIGPITTLTKSDI